MHYINISLGLMLNCHLSVDVARTDETKAHSFLQYSLYCTLYAAPEGNFISDVVCITSNVQRLRFFEL